MTAGCVARMSFRCFNVQLNDTMRLGPLRPLLTYLPDFWLRQHWESRTAGFLDLHQIVTKNSGPPPLDGWRRPDAAREPPARA